MTRHPGSGSLWRDRGFTVFLTAQTLSVAGDSFALIAVPLLVLRATGSVAQMGLLTGVAGAAAVVAGIFAGILADRLDRWNLMAACDLSRMVLYGLIPLAWAFHPRGLAALRDPAGLRGDRHGLPGRLRHRGPGPVGPRPGSPKPMASSTAAQSAAGVAGPLLAGLVSALLGPAGAIGVNAASFAVSAAGVLVVRHELSSRRRGRRRTPRAPAGPVPAGCSATPSGTATPGASGAASPGGPGSGSPDAAGAWRELLAGARFLWQHPALRALTVLLTFFIFATYGLPDVLIYYLKHGLGQGDGVVGLVLAIAALGTVAGALAVAPLRRRLGFGRCWTGAVVLCGLAVAGLGASGSVPAVAVLAALYLGCISVAGISSMSLRQEVTPDHLLGRVTAAFWTIHFSLGPLGAALLTWAAGHFGVMAACVASGAACLVIGTIGLATPIRGRARRPGVTVAGTCTAGSATRSGRASRPDPGAGGAGFPRLIRPGS